MERGGPAPGHHFRNRTTGLQPFIRCGKVAFSPDSKTFASTTQTGDLWVWNVNGSDSMPSLKMQLSWENQVVAFSPCGKHLMAEAPSYGLEIRSTRSWEVMHTLIGHSSSLCDVAFSACGGEVGSASCDGTVRVWDTENWELLHTLQHKEPVLSVAFSRHRDVVASGCWDNNIRLWSADTGQLQHVLTEHGGAPLSLEFSPVEDLLVSDSGDGTVKIWDITHVMALESIPLESEMQAFDSCEDSVSRICMSQDCTRVAAGSLKGAVRLWDGLAFFLLNTY
ncbi:unnamed protein product [Penicillium palitans]